MSRCRIAELGESRLPGTGPLKLHARDPSEAKYLSVCLQRTRKANEARAPTSGAPPQTCVPTRPRAPVSADPPTGKTLMSRRNGGKGLGTLKYLFQFLWR